MAVIMTAKEIHHAMWDMVSTEYEECKTRLEAVPKDRKGERKALQIELGMYNVCMRGGLLSEESEDVLPKRWHFVKRFLPEFPSVRHVFQMADEEEQLRITAALGGDMFMRSQFLRSYHEEMKQAQTAGDAAQVFEWNIKIGALNKVLTTWENWRAEHGIYPHMFEEEAK